MSEGRAVKNRQRPLKKLVLNRQNLDLKKTGKKQEKNRQRILRKKSDPWEV